MMLFWKVKKKKLQRQFLEEVEFYAQMIRTEKERVGEHSLTFEKRMRALKKETEDLLLQTRNEKIKESLQWLSFAVDEYMFMSHHAKQTLLGNEKSRKKVQKHQEKGFAYYQKFSK